MKLSRVDDYDQVKVIVDTYPMYRPFFESVGGSEKSLEDRFFEKEAILNKGWINSCKS